MAHRTRLCREGDVVLRAGERVGVAEVGILATVGAVQLAVHAVPRVAVLSTGGLGVRRTRVPRIPGGGALGDCDYRGSGSGTDAKTVHAYRYTDTHP